MVTHSVHKAGYLSSASLVPEARKVPGESLAPIPQGKLGNTGNYWFYCQKNQQQEGRPGEGEINFPLTEPFYLGCYQKVLPTIRVGFSINQGNQDTASNDSPISGDSNLWQDDQI